MLEWEEYFEPHILQRGRNYARNGAVQHIKKQGDTIEAVVAGSEYYKVKLQYDGHVIYESYCCRGQKNRIQAVSEEGKGDH